MTQSTDLEFADIVKPLEWERRGHFIDRYYARISNNSGAIHCSAHENEWYILNQDRDIVANGKCLSLDDGREQVNNFLKLAALSFLDTEKLAQYKARIAELESENKKLTSTGLDLDKLPSPPWLRNGRGFKSPSMKPSKKPAQKTGARGAHVVDVMRAIFTRAYIAKYSNVLPVLDAMNVAA